MARPPRFQACKLWEKKDMLMLANVAVCSPYSFLYPWTYFLKSGLCLSFAVNSIKGLKWSHRCSFCGSRNNKQSSGNSTRDLGGGDMVQQLDQEAGTEAPWGPWGTLRISWVPLEVCLLYAKDWWGWARSCICKWHPFLGLFIYFYAEANYLCG